jgi:ribonuclease PH
MKNIIRASERKPNQLRPVQLTYDIFEYADGSVLFELGKTKVLCAVTLQQGVPPFLRGKKTGWLSAEYALLPTATPTRNARESIAGKRNGRTVEISRLISRALRSVVNLDLLDERTVVVDCDVLQADGGTRTACITGAYLALKQAAFAWQREGIIQGALLHEELAAISVGIIQGVPVLDMDFSEDSTSDADFNIVATRSGLLVEIQGTAERAPLSGALFDTLKALALQGIHDLFKTIDYFDDSKQMQSNDQKGLPLFMRVQYHKQGE